MSESAAEWPWPHFSRVEMACRGEHCCDHACEMQPGFMNLLEMLRQIVGQPLAVTSGYRCPAHNTAVGGHPNSPHLRGLAADIACDGRLAYELVKRATALGFTGLGIGRTFLHLDVSHEPPRPNVWTYP